MNPATWLVSRELTDAAGRWDIRLRGGGTDDGEYFCRAILASNGIRFVPGAKVFYRITGSGSLSYIGRSNKKMESLLLAMQLQIGHVLSLDDSKRSRAACLNYFKRGCPLSIRSGRTSFRSWNNSPPVSAVDWKLPRLSWKYAWIEKLFGFAAAKHAELYYNRAKSSALRAWDRMMYSLERNGSCPASKVETVGTSSVFCNTERW